ncbi:MAG: hypothetical protein R3255_07750 [Candidatus Lokiarchaeia archaeon]|nr:hypothetical protein [Candidatus Lokiarchaeia archaeon]
MSLGNIYKFYDKEFREEMTEEHYKISDMVIPFSRLFKNYKPSDIYSGIEKIPFKERDPEYKMILRQEF